MIQGKPAPRSEVVRKAWATRRLNFERDFWQRVTRAESGCWLWIGAGHRYGYGQLYREGKLVGAHRVAWELAHGPIPDGLWVLHHCDTPACVRTKPDEQWPEGHLFLGTCADNVADMYAKGRGPVYRPFVHSHGDSHYARTHPERLARGERHGMAKLTATKAAEIRARYEPVRGRVTALAIEYGVDRRTIHNIVAGRIWKPIELVGPNRDPR